jgi:polyphosphate glucokinase
VRETEDLKLKQWAPRVATYLKAMQNLFYPDLMIVGGGVSKKSDKWLPAVEKELDTAIVPAHMRNEAGIVGAAAAVALSMSTNESVGSEDDQIPS